MGRIVLICSIVAIFSVITASAFDGFKDQIYSSDVIQINCSMIFATFENSILRQIGLLLEDYKSLLGLSTQNKIKNTLTIIFYLVLIIFVVFWIVELFIKIPRKIVGKEHKEPKGKKIARVAFKTTLWGKFIFLIIAASGLFIQAVGVSEFYKKYIKKPENLMSLLREDVIFLTILTILVVIRVFGFRRRKY